MRSQEGISMDAFDALPPAVLAEIEQIIDQNIGTPEKAAESLHQLSRRHGGRAVHNHLLKRMKELTEQQVIARATLEEAKRRLDFLQNVDADSVKMVPTPKRTRALNKPRWEGTVGFDRAWAETMTLLQHPDFRRDGELIVLAPEHMQAEVVAAELADDRVIRFDPEQLMVLPDWEGHENLCDFAADVELPFPHIFLDFELYDRWPTWNMDRLLTGLKLMIRSACLFRDPYEGSRLVVIPRASFESSDGSHAPRSLGLVTFSPWDGTSPHSWEQQVISGARPGHEGMMFAATFLAARVEGHEGMIVMLPNTQETYDLAADSIDLPSRGNALANLAASITVFAVDRIMAALSILDSEVVDLEDAPVPRQSRRRMEREGGKIAKIVSIRSPRRGPTNKPSGEEAHYSHRFWVRGHTKHYPVGTHMADVRPDLVKPCTRTIGACERGCRRIWTPPFIKGPADRPLVLKTLVRRSPTKEKT
jgi:hypothetical protein